jgi:ribonuclease HII
MTVLKSSYGHFHPEAGCDEAGRGCLAGPVVAAAVILKTSSNIPGLDDSKKLTHIKRLQLRELIVEQAIAIAVAFVDHLEIDEMNILNASFLAMHQALKQLKPQPALILVDGNRFQPYENIPHQCIVKGDGKFMSIAAASVIAKTTRDDYMVKIHQEFPHYQWLNNKGYPTLEHKMAILKHGFSPYHRRSFSASIQLKLF